LRFDFDNTDRNTIKAKSLDKESAFESSTLHTFSVIYLQYFATFYYNQSLCDYCDGVRLSFFFSFLETNSSIRLTLCCFVKVIQESIAQNSWNKSLYDTIEPLKCGSNEAIRS
jgi:hypothetical protein